MSYNIRKMAKFLVYCSTFLSISESLTLKEDFNFTNVETESEWIANGDMVTKIPTGRRLDDVPEMTLNEEIFCPEDINDKRQPRSNSGQDSYWELYSQLDSGKNQPIYNQESKPVLFKFRYIFVPIWWSDENTSDAEKVIQTSQINSVMDYNKIYYNRMSFGKFNFDEHIILPQTVIPVSSTKPGFGDLENAARNLVTAGGYTANVDYDGIVILYNVAQDGPFQGQGGWGSVNSEASVTWMSWKRGLSNDVARHEFGHNFGHPHHLTNGYKWRFGQEGVVGYDDYDMMSGGNHYDISDFALAAKWYFGWVPNSSVINMQPHGSTAECADCASQGTYTLYPFDGNDNSQLMGIHIPITTLGNTLYSYWLSYRSNNGAEKGLSIHVGWFSRIGGGQFGASYDSLNYDAYGDTETREDSFVTPGTCYHVSPSVKMLEIDPGASIATQPVVCVEQLSEGDSITINVSFTNPNGDLLESQKSKPMKGDTVVMQCGTSLNSAIGSNTDQLFHIENTGMNGIASLNLCSSSGSATAYIYDRFPTSVITYSAPGAYGAFKSLSASTSCSGGTSTEYEAVHNEAWVLVRTNSAVTLEASCTVDRCQVGQKKVGGKCLPCQGDDDNCEKCPGGLQFLISTCIISESIKEITSSKKWRIWTPGYHTLRGWLWDVFDLEFYSNLDCTGMKYNDGSPIDSGNAGGGWNPAKAFDANDRSAWGGRSDADELFWIGMEFGSEKDVKCVSILDNPDNGVSELRIQAWEEDTSTWQNVKIVKDYQSGVRNNLSLDFTDFTSPTASPTNSPSESPSESPETSSCTQDNSDKFAYTRKKSKTCAWLEGKSEEKQTKICRKKVIFSDTHSPAENVCVETCNSCDPCFENPTGKSYFFWKINKDGDAKYKTCKWLKKGNRANKNCGKTESNEGRGPPKQVCPVTCSAVTSCVR